MPCRQCVAAGFLTVANTMGLWGGGLCLRTAGSLGRLARAVKARRDVYALCAAAHGAVQAADHERHETQDGGDESEH